MDRTNNNRAFPFVLGTLFGCLGTIILGICMAGSLVALVARADSSGWDAAQSNDPVARGQQVFQSRCSHCHSAGTEVKVGPGLAGLFSPGGPTLPGGVDYEGRLPNGEEIDETNVTAWIREGGSGQIGNMPGQSLTDEQMTALLAYLKTVQK